jgi:hypothetical protein
VLFNLLGDAFQTWLEYWNVSPSGGSLVRLDQWACVVE